MARTKVRFYNLWSQLIKVKWSHLLTFLSLVPNSKLAWTHWLSRDWWPIQIFRGTTPGYRCQTHSNLRFHIKKIEREQMLILARKLKSIFLHFICNSILTFCDFFSNKPMTSTNSWAGRFYLRARATLMPTCAEFSPFCGFLERWSKYSECTTAKVQWMEITKKVSFEFPILKIQVYVPSNNLWDNFERFWYTVQKGSNCSNISTVVKILYYTRRWMSAIMAKIHVNPQGFYPKPLSNYFYRKDHTIHYSQHPDIKFQNTK